MCAASEARKMIAGASKVRCVLLIVSSGCSSVRNWVSAGVCARDDHGATHNPEWFIGYQLANESCLARDYIRWNLKLPGQEGKASEAERRIRLRCGDSKAEKSYGWTKSPGGPNSRL